MLCLSRDGRAAVRNGMHGCCGLLCTCCQPRADRLTKCKIRKPQRDLIEHAVQSKITPDMRVRVYVSLAFCIASRPCGNDLPNADSKRSWCGIAGGGSRVCVCVCVCVVCVRFFFISIYNAVTDWPMKRLQSCNCSGTIKHEHAFSSTDRGAGRRSWTAAVSCF